MGQGPGGSVGPHLRFPAHGQGVEGVGVSGGTASGPQREARGWRVGTLSTPLPIDNQQPSPPAGV